MLGKKVTLQIPRGKLDKTIIDGPVHVYLMNNLWYAIMKSTRWNGELERALEKRWIWERV